MNAGAGVQHHADDGQGGGEADADGGLGGRGVVCGGRVRHGARVERSI